MEDLHKRWPHRWLTKKTKSFQSPIDGLGVVATDDVQEGETILVYGGIIVPLSEIEKYRSKMGHVGIQIADNFFICPTTKEELGQTGIINHSCEPNLGFKSPVELITIKDIKSGEELTLDYAFCESVFEAFECNCRTTSCRQVIKPADWQSNAIQKKYGEYFSPYLKSKI